MDLIQIRNQWQNEGFCILTNFIDSARLNNLQIICDNILQQWFANASNPVNQADATNMAYLTDPIYFKDNATWLVELLEVIADEKILEILQFISGGEVLFHNTQYFFNPTYSGFGKSSYAIWHRDTQFLAPEPELEKERMKEGTGVHFRIAFLNDNCLEYVPGSEKRWDTPEEYAIRKGESGKKPNSNDMPGKKRISLNRGDALLFHAWGIHRGIYDVHTPRRTFDIIYMLGKACDYYPPPATCFNTSDLLNKLSPAAKDFFQHFIKTYEKYWIASKIEIL